MTVFIGIAVVVLLLAALVLWTSRRSTSGRGSEVSARSRSTRLSAQEQATRWGAGT